MLRLASPSPVLTLLSGGQQSIYAGQALLLYIHLLYTGEPSKKMGLRESSEENVTI